MNRPDDEPISEIVDLHAIVNNVIEITNLHEYLISAQLSLKVGSMVNFCDINEIIDFYETANGVYTKLNYQGTIFIFIAKSRRI